MSLTVTVTDNETGATETVQVADADYFIVCTNPCYVDGIQAYPKAGTHVLTVKGQRARNLPTLRSPLESAE